MKKLISFFLCFVLICFSFASCKKQKKASVPANNAVTQTIENLPEYNGSDTFIFLNDNRPNFDDALKTSKSFETYYPLDNLGRCTMALACISKDLMPTEERGSIGQVKPTGWHTVKYDNVDGKYLYNRCHLIGFQLTGENANELNLITGTRYMNVEGMLPFENMVADYIKETSNRVLYRVTPHFEGENLLASGVQIEAYSIEDNGEGISFNVYVYNVQPGIEIDYSNGESREKTDLTAETNEEICKFILNTNSKKYHKPECKNALDIKENNKAEFEGSESQLKEKGYTACKSCFN